LVIVRVKEPYSENWGYALEIDNPEFKLFVGCGNYEEYAEGFLGFIVPDKPYLRKFFRKIDTTSRVDAVSDALEAALRKHPGVRELRWWPDSKRRE
jgi:hypothetical protein